MLWAILAVPMLGCQTKAENNQRVIKAPDFQLVDINGEKVSLSGLKGKVVFLDFWATWCPPCIIASPAVEQIANDYKSKDVAVLSVSLDSQESTVKNFLKTHKFTSRVIMAGNSGIDARYRVEGIPAYFIIDKNGNLAKAWEGYKPSLKTIWRKEIDRLLEL